MRIQNQDIKKILKKYQLLWSLEYLTNLAGWDLETYMPPHGATDRGIAMANLAELQQKLFLDQDFVKLIKLAAKSNDLNIYEQRIVNLLERDLKQYQKLPAQLISEFVKVTNQAQVAWREARAQNDFAKFLPYMQKIVELSIQKANYLGYTGHPYDALLDEFEEGQTVARLDKTFAEVKDFVKQLLDKIYQSKNYGKSSPLSKEPYTLAAGQQLNQQILHYFNADFGKLRLDVSTHPFTSMQSANDIRITTRYHQKDIARSILATIHEFGHALYDLQCNQDFSYTPLWGASSLGLHESQSRFWENFIGRSSKFSQKFVSNFAQLGENYQKYNGNDYYQYFNIVKPSLLRVEADEITYHLHIIIRYEIEKGLIDGSIKAQDLIEVWNSKYQEYLGIKAHKLTNGVLQDIHWSMGAIGYFPTYSLGTILSATWLEQLQKDLGSIENLLLNADGIVRIQNWLKNNIHQFGSLYTFEQMIHKVTKHDFSIEPWKSYLSSKFLNIYN